MEVDLVGLFRDLVRLETELWNRVGARLQHAYGLPLAWLEIMQVVSATGDCRVLDIVKAFVDHRRWGEQSSGQGRSCRVVPTAT
jgi:hypothetical protein